MIEYKEVEEKYISEAAELAMQEYKRECASCPQLIENNYVEQIKNLLKYLFGNKYGKVAVEDDKVIGYMAFTEPIEGFFGNVKGIYSPLGGSGFSGRDRAKLSSRLIEEVGNEIIKDGISSIALSMYAHDEEVGRAFVMNGFGIRCSDAILKLDKRDIKWKSSSDFEFFELANDEKLKVRDLRQKLTRHLSKAPVFMPSELSDDSSWYERKEIRVFAAKRQNEVIGFMSTAPDGETFVTEHKKMRNICGAYVEKKYRGCGVADQLLEFVCQTHEKEGYEYMGVDCETLNPTALRYWSKNFSNYTYSFARRLDERIIGYEDYINEQWGIEK